MNLLSDAPIYYDMPPVRCTSCNKPIGHLYESYQQLLDMNHSMEDVFECIGIFNYCCKKELYMCTRTNLVTCKDYKMKDCPENHKLNVYKEIDDKIHVDYERDNVSGIPLELTTSKTVKVLSEVLYVNYIKNCNYLAQ